MQIKISKIEQSASEMLQGLEHQEYFAAKISNLKPDSRRLQEVLAVRCLLKDLLGHEAIVEYSAQGAPSLPYENCQVSISHTDGYAAVIIGDEPVGIDIERRGRRVQKVASRFLQPQEEQLIDSLQDPILAMHLVWSAKESAFKILGEKYYDLQNLTEIVGFDFEKKIMTMNVKGLQEPLTVHFEYTDEYVLTYIC